MNIAAAGDRALLATLPGASSARLRAAADAARGVPGVVAAIVGTESIYVIGTADSAALRAAIDAAPEAAAKGTQQHRIAISLHPQHALDLDEFLARVGVSRHAFASRLSDIRLSVRYLGFRAAFPYCDGWPPDWAMPRRATSRNHVAAGSFGIAAGIAGFYPVDSPGGWNILGRTAAPLWDPQREPPNLLAPGDSLILRETKDPLPERSAVPPLQHLKSAVAHVITPGQLTTIVGAPDWSRVEHGVPPGGPFDEQAASAANLGVGNAPGTPLLECVLVGPKLQFATPCKLAWCGADLAVRTWHVRAGEVIDIGRIHGGMRGYLAVENGIDEMRLRYAESPAVLKRDDVLARPLIRASGTFSPHAGRRDSINIIRVKPGPHAAPALPEEWEVTPQMNRVGIRLRALRPVDVKLPADLPSLGAQFGTLQWHADGTLVALGPDHPVTGGYLQPATLLWSERWKLGQLAPGERVRLLAV